MFSPSALSSDWSRLLTCAMYYPAGIQILSFTFCTQLALFHLTRSRTTRVSRATNTLQVDGY